MTKNKAGKALSLVLKPSTDKIYYRDPVRYARLIVWVYRQQRVGYSDEAIAETLEMADSCLDEADDWWIYLTKLIRKGHTAAFDKEAQEMKKPIDPTPIKAIFAEMGK